MKPPYLILHKQSRILNTPNSVACVFDDIGSKCKMMYHFKISANGGTPFAETRSNLLLKFSPADAARAHRHLGPEPR